MALRRELLAPVLDAQNLVAACGLATEVESSLAEGEGSSALDAFNLLTGASCSAQLFRDYPEVMSQEDFVRSRMAHLPRVPRLDRSDLLELALVLFDHDDELADWEMNYYLRLFAAHVDHEDVLALLAEAESPGELVDLARWIW